jgi:phage/plasmid-like protein (TIGR03299 family)
MSRETIQWLNENVLSGFGRVPWHFDSNFQTDTSNVYPGAIPVTDVEKRLFNFQLASRRMFMEIPCSIDEATGIGEDGSPVKLVLQEDMQAIARDDNHVRMGTFTHRYAKHPYTEWLVQKVSGVIGDTLSIGSAGLLKGGKVAWVSIEIPDYQRTSKNGVTIQPRLLSVTSCDGSIATTYKMVVTHTVCDNTMGTALAEDGAAQKFKHTSGSTVKVPDTRRALGLIEAIGDFYDAEAERLIGVKVTDQQFGKFVDLVAPIPAEKGRSRTLATNKQDVLRTMWTSDKRVLPWVNTAFGVVQTMNTFDHHLASGIKGIRPERNLMNTIKGEFNTLDLTTLQVLEEVLPRQKGLLVPAGFVEAQSKGRKLVAA